MAKVKDEGKRTLSVQVDERTFYKFLFKCESRGQSRSDRMRELLMRDIEESEVDAAIAETAKKEAEYASGATERQKAYIYALIENCVDSGIDHGVTEDIEKITNRGADKIIRTLKGLLEERASMEA